MTLDAVDAAELSADSPTDLSTKDEGIGHGPAIGEILMFGWFSGCT